jgi:hypothetical protein
MVPAPPAPMIAERAIDPVRLQAPVIPCDVSIIDQFEYGLTSASDSTLERSCGR